MPILNKRERVEAIIRYIHSHKWQQNTADLLARELDIPVATVRKTLSTDYPECFDRDPDDRRNITLVPFVWPDNRPFDPEPPISKEGKLKAEYMNNVFALSTVFQTGVLDMIDKWADEGLALKKSPETYYKLWNTLNLMVSYMQLIKSKDPKDKARRLFDEPESIPKIMDLITQIEKGLSR